MDLRGRADVALPTSGLFGDLRFPLSYFLHHIPVRDRARATGHAVRELYLQAGVVDVAVETADLELLSTSEAIWEDLFGTKTYVTGAHGSRHRDESIGDAYELPSDRAYGETCAAIAKFSMELAPPARHGPGALCRRNGARVLEHDRRCRIAAGHRVLLFEHPAPEDWSRQRGRGRSASSPPLVWVSLLPTKPRALMASIQGYLITRDSSGLQVQLPFSGAVTEVPGGNVDLAVRTGHPWAGTTDIEVTRCSSGERWDLSLRLPEWARKGATRVTVNGETVHAPLEGSYVRVAKHWCSGDHLQVSDSVPIRVLRPHWRVDAVRDCLAVQRGPLVYCVEADDLDEGVAVEDVVLDATRPLEPTVDVPDDLQGYVKLAISASGESVDGSAGPLYGDKDADQVRTQPLALTLVPYFARGNRPAAAIRVWVPARQGQSGTQPAELV